ncbi:MAG: hypothetical protein U0U70_09285 [Chitinophagaceae bacterium]
MRIIKLGLISAVVFSLLITGISLFFPSRIRISKAADIKAGRPAILQQLKDTLAWKQWYPGTDSATGLPVITEITDSSVTAQSLLQNGRRGITGWNLYESGVPGTVTVQWYMDFRLRWYPWEKFSGLLFEKRYGPVMEKGLENLKKLLNNSPDSK